MKFDNEKTRDVRLASPEEARLVHLEPRWWKTGGVILLGVLGIALAGIVVSTLHGCGPTDSIDRDDVVQPEKWVTSPPPAVAPEIDGTESTSHAIVSGGFFGNSGFGTNFYCPVGGYGCYCDPQPGSGMDGMTTDCKDLQRSQSCDPGSKLECSRPPEGTRTICQCVQRGQMGGSCPSFECPIASNLLATGLWKDGAGNYFRRLPDSDRSCWSPNALVPPGVTIRTATGSNYNSLVATYSNQQCTPEEASGMVTMTPSGYFQTPDTLVHFKVNRRSCQISLPQWNARRFLPPITQQSFAAADAHRSNLWCTDRELQAAGFLN